MNPHSCNSQGILSPSCLPIPPFEHRIEPRAENETRTRDPNLGKVMLYQLSYFRILNLCPEQDSNLHASRHTHLKRARLPFRHLGIRRAENETRTRDPNLGKVMLYQLSYFRISFLVLRCKYRKFLNTHKTFVQKNIYQNPFQTQKQTRTFYYLTEKQSHNIHITDKAQT